MKLERFIYLNIPHISSLYSQLRGEDVVETLCSVEHSRLTGLKLALTSFLGGSAESSSKQAIAKKIVLRPENMIREIVASLQAHGKLHSSLMDALARTDATSNPVWFEVKHPFSMPIPLEQCNLERTVIFQSGYTQYFQTPNQRGAVMMCWLLPVLITAVFNQKKRRK